MAGRERNCKWHFSNLPIGSREDGPNNPLEQSYKKHPYASLIRESIQNSLDAVYDHSKPVVVKFSFKQMNGADYPEFFELEKHIQGCLDYYPQNRNAKLLYEPMLKLFSGDNQYHQTINFIRVSDYNTTGMSYKDGDTSKPFYAFVRSAGVSAKDNAQAGGSFGFGKAAYFLLSPISTIIVSTCTKDYDKYFEGVSSLCTHTYKGEKKMAVGYYDSNSGMPISSAEEIPTTFKREEPGTDINILGFDIRYREEAVTEMIEAVLRNFWLAVLNERLSVVIDDIEINKGSIESLLDKHFPDESDNSRKGGYDNPRPYFDAVRFANTSSRYKRIDENLALLGKCTLYLNRQKHATDKVAYLREPQMLVYSKRTKTNYGVYGVFCCEDKDGNEILRNLENSAHDEWKAANWTSLGRKIPEGSSALKILDNFVSRNIADFFSSGKNKLAINIKGLEEFLYIPTEYEEYEDFDSEALVGEPTGIIKDEGGSPTTIIPDSFDNPTISKEGSMTSVGAIMVNFTTNATTSTDGRLLSGHGDKPRKTKDGGIQKPGDHKNSNVKDEEGKHGVFANPINLPYRSFSQKENGILYHYVVLHADEDYANVRIHLFSVGEDGENELEILETSEGNVVGSAIENIELNSRRKRLRIRFADKMKHTIKLEAEELHEV